MTLKLIFRRLAATYFILWGIYEISSAGQFPHTGFQQVLGICLIVSGVGQAWALHQEKKKKEHASQPHE